MKRKRDEEVGGEGIDPHNVDLQDALRNTTTLSAVEIDLVQDYLDAVHKRILDKVCPVIKDIQTFAMHYNVDEVTKQGATLLVTKLGPHKVTPELVTCLQKGAEYMGLDEILICTRNSFTKLGKRNKFRLQPQLVFGCSNGAGSRRYIKDTISFLRRVFWIDIYDQLTCWRPLPSVASLSFILAKSEPTTTAMTIGISDARVKESTPCYWCDLPSQDQKREFEIWDALLQFAKTLCKPDSDLRKRLDRCVFAWVSVTHTTVLSVSYFPDQLVLAELPMVVVGKDDRAGQ